MTSSCHRCLGFPTGLVPIGFQSSSFLVGLAWSVLWICPSHLILCALMNLTISAPSIKLSISMLFRILRILSILTGPNMFPTICLSKMRRLLCLINGLINIDDKQRREGCSAGAVYTWYTWVKGFSFVHTSTKISHFFWVSKVTKFKICTEPQQKM
jgi:hypothetical protein